MVAIDPPGPTTPCVICDAGPLIHLDELGCLDLLSDFAEVVVPPSVWAEVSRHRPLALSNAAVPFCKVLPAAPLTVELQVICQLLSLHRGEIDALQVASERPGCILLTDDAAARLAARNLRLAAHGTLGVLLRAIRRGQRSRAQIVTVLRAIPSVSTLHIRISLLEEIIRQAKTGA